AVEPTAVLDASAARSLDRSQQFALVAAIEAWADAGEPDVDPDRLAVVVSTGIGGVTTLLDQDEVLRTRGARRVSPFTVPRIMPNGPSAAVGLHHVARAGVHELDSPCPSGAGVIARVLDLLRAGRADALVARRTEAAFGTEAA